MERYFFPLRSENLAGYISSAIIKPRNYFRNRQNMDIQERYPGFLFVSTKPYILNDNADCSIELILTDKEIINLRTKQLNSDCFLYDKPLPVTRIKSIQFKNKEQSNITLKTISLSTGFIPSRLISDEISTDYADNKFENYDFLPTDLKYKTDDFNRQLGGFAMMRLVIRNGMNYSESYFYRLSRYNKRIEAVIKNTPLGNAKELAYKDPVLAYCKSVITDEIIKKVASREKQKLKKDNTRKTYILEPLQDATYILAFIRDHKANDNDEGRDKIDGYIINRFSTAKYAEDLAFYYGYNKGYSAFVKNYKSTDNNEVIYKYKLETLLDYYTIESLYEYCINGNTINNNISYIDNLFINELKTYVSLKQDEINILGEIVTCKKKDAGYTDYSQELSKFHSEVHTQIQKIEKSIIELHEADKKQISDNYNNEINRYQREISNLQEKVKTQQEKINILEKQLYSQPKEETISVLSEKEFIYSASAQNKDMDSFIKVLEDYIVKTNKLTKKDIKKIIEQYRGAEPTLNM